MRVQSVQSSKCSFNGGYALKKSVSKETGVSYYNKVNYKLHEFVYHPFENETAEQIANAIKSNFRGRSFYLVEKEHGHRDGLYYQMNRVVLGSKIKPSDNLEKLGLTEEPIAGILNDDAFYEVYNNNQYATMDVEDLDDKRVIEIATKGGLLTL
ncbi:MAG: hypothetical protein MJ237_06900 [bacterium]|nr:hypothetical protein [bacterium]